MVLEELKNPQKKVLNINKLQKNKKKSIYSTKKSKSKNCKDKISITIENYIQPDDYSIPSNTLIQQPTSQVVKTRQPSKIPVRVKKAVSGEGNEDEEREKKDFIKKNGERKILTK